jgi:hypothetical protein
MLDPTLDLRVDVLHASLVDGDLTDRAHGLHEWRDLRAHGASPHELTLARRQRERRQPFDLEAGGRGRFLDFFRHHRHSHRVVPRMIGGLVGVHRRAVNRALGARLLDVFHQSHLADRALPRLVGHDLRMHRTVVEHASRGGDYRRRDRSSSRPAEPVS